MTKINKKTRFAYLSTIFLLLLGACEKDFSVNSENTEPFPIIYTLLNPADNVHYVKVFKSYLVDGNAYDAVTDLDKYSYIDSIDVYLVEYDGNGNNLRTIYFYSTTEVPKDSGLFGYPTQIIYRADAQLSRDYTYQLFVYNPYTKNIACNEKPIVLAGQSSIADASTKTTIVIPENSVTMKFSAGINSTKYLLRIWYYYSEDLIDNTSRQPDPILWTMGTVSGNLSTAKTEKSLTIGSGSDFFKRIASEVKEDPDVYRRRTDSLVYEIYSAARDWDLYIQSTTPSTGLNQNKLYYSNLKAYNTETGEEKYVMGFVSSRAILMRQYRDLAKPATIDSLINGRFTKHLKFTDSY